jgi:hypothetical protein
VDPDFVFPLPGPKLAYTGYMGHGEGRMKAAPREKFRVLAESKGWSLDHAKGYIDGEIFRLRGKQPSKHVLVGIDEYSLGFRAGFYERENSNLAAEFAHSTAAPR